MVVFDPFLGDFFSIINHLRSIAEEQNVFVPFLGDLFFNRLTFSLYWMIRATCFRPLSRGLFSIFVSGDANARECAEMFSSPFLGTFFQYARWASVREGVFLWFSSPFSGTFFNKTSALGTIWTQSFRPLSWGPFSIRKALGRYRCD